MPALLDRARTAAHEARGVADNADFLSFALTSGDPTRIESSVDDLLSAYAQYSGSAAASERLALDSQAVTSEIDDGAGADAAALASALLDLQVAAVLGNAAEATDEGTDTGELDQAVQALLSTSHTVGDSSNEGLVGRLGLDEEAIVAVESPDQATAKVSYNQQVQVFYDALLSQTAAVLLAGFRDVSGVDPEKLGEALKTFSGTAEQLPGGRLARAALEALRRAISVLKALIGGNSLDQLEGDMRLTRERVAGGADAMQLFLEYAYGYESGKREIAALLESTPADTHAIDGGVLSVGELQTQMVATFTLAKRLVDSLQMAKRPLGWVLSRVGGTLPADVLFGAASLLVLQVSLLRGMDYADTTTIVRMLDGIRVTSRKVLVPL